MTRRLTIAAMMTVLCAGCVGLNKVTPPLRYVIEPKPAIAAVEKSEFSIAVRTLEAARPYKQNVVYREGEELGTYSTVEWSELPSDATTRAIVDALDASGRFKDVGSALDLASPDLILTGQLRRFDLVRDAEPWTAVCEIRLELRKSQGREPVWSRTLTAVEPLEAPNNAALPRAMNTALGRLIQEAVAAIVAN
ncbi:MAG TPA: ABC-type transport auxiliary lipoprotein family protein [Candidatus Hydrogenedentes bacterium]|nr:ABC-type transport auxiliary lipoprotein family protein [Candidatus Hydrogenedentota bacterium]HRK34391.1 ABC-type transport auxiliary lipoprotein family protein [Candidatus Hydrogenedentota bacterium]